MEATWEPVGVSKLKAIAVLIGVVVIVTVIAIGSSIVNIGGSDVGIVEKKFGGGELPTGRILAVNGENGIQAQVLTPGWKFFYWAWQYDITKTGLTEIKEGYVGLVQSADGRSLPEGAIYAPQWEDADKMVDAAYFLGEGNGYKGPQLSVLKPGKYRLNTKLFTVTQVPIMNVRVGTVAVIKSNVGDVVEAKDRLVEVGQRGIWNKPLGEGQYYLNTHAYEATLVSIRQVKVSYTAEMEPGEALKGQPLRPITVRSKDGFTFPVDVRMTFKIEPENAPRVVAKIGGDELVLNKLVTPRVRATFRDNAEKVKALDYVQNRSKQGKQSLVMLKEELAGYGVKVLGISIGDVGDEKTLGTLLKTQMDREIALQEQATFEEQQRAEEKKKALTRTTQEAEEEKRLATAAYGVKVATEEKLKRIIEAEAEAQRVMLVAEAKAKAYQKISDVIGADNAALLELMKLVAENRIRITPEVMVGGGGAGMTDALMGTVLRGMIEKGGAGKGKP